MDRSTLESVRSLHRWIEDAMRADVHVTALRAALPDANIDNGMGDIRISVKGAKVSDIVPALRAARVLGFKSSSRDANALRWSYSISEGDEKPVPLTISLRIAAPKDEATCEQVVVGQKVVDVVEWKCGDELTAWKEKEAAAS